MIIELHTRKMMVKTYNIVRFKVFFSLKIFHYFQNLLLKYFLNKESIESLIYSVGLNTKSNYFYYC